MNSTVTATDSLFEGPNCQIKMWEVTKMRKGGGGEIGRERNENEIVGSGKVR